MSKTSACLNIFYLNSRSIVNKLDELRALCLANNYKFDVICVVESWLSPDISDAEIFIPSFKIFRRDRNRHGGGILIFVKDTLVCTTISLTLPFHLLSFYLYVLNFVIVGIVFQPFIDHLPQMLPILIHYLRPLDH